MFRRRSIIGRVFEEGVIRNVFEGGVIGKVFEEGVIRNVFEIGVIGKVFEEGVVGLGKSLTRMCMLARLFIGGCMGMHVCIVFSAGPSILRSVVIQMPVL